MSSDKPLHFESTDQSPDVLKELVHEELTFEVLQEQHILGTWQQSLRLRAQGARDLGLPVSST